MSNLKLVLNLRKQKLADDAAEAPQVFLPQRLEAWICRAPHFFESQDNKKWTAGCV
jgi:hypothetical protein